MRQTLLAVTILLGAIALNGCHIDTDQHGDNKKVKISTPFGGLQVRTNDANVLAGIGLPAYPGAILVKRESGSGKGDDGAADVSMSFGSFQLKVKAASYRTSDTPQQVLEFYRKALGRFGDVVQCDGKKTVGTPVRTSEGLTCDDNDTSHLHVSGDQPSDGHSTRFELKAGSRKHQHIVSIHAEGSATRFGLVSLDLPGNFSFTPGDSSDEHKQ